MRKYSFVDLKFHFVSSLAGYSSAFTVQELNEQELVKLEEFARTIPDLIRKYCSANEIDQQRETPKICRLFLGLHNNASSFQIFNGQKILLLRVASWVKAKVSREVTDDFSSFSESNYGPARSLTMQTKVGKLFVNFVADEKSKKNPIKRTTKKKTIAFSNKRSGVAVNSSNCGSISKGTPSISPYDDTTLKKFITDSCQLRLKTALESYFEKTPAEEKFMKSCGVNNLEELKMNVILNEFELQRLFNIDNDNVDTFNEDFKTPQSNNLIKATIKCYCSIKNPCNVIIYFRINSKWIMLNSGQVHPNDPITYLSTAWVSVNFTKHLRTHQKFHTETEETDFECEYFVHSKVSRI